MLSVAVSIVSFFPMLIFSAPSAQMTVTPPATTYFGGSEETLELKKCYNQSIIPSGPYTDFCVNYRKCIPGSFSENVYFQEFEDFNTVSFSSINEYMKVYTLLFAQLKRANTENARRCIKYATPFICGAYYPLCYTRENNLGETVHQIIPPCRQLCLSTEMYCKSELERLNYKWEEASSIFNCTRYQDTSSCAKFDCSSNKTETEPTDSAEPSTDSAEPSTDSAEPSTDSAEPSTDSAEPSTEPIPSSTVAEAQTAATEAPTEPPTEPSPSPAAGGDIMPTSVTTPRPKECMQCRKIRDKFHKTPVQSDVYKFLAYVSISSNAFSAMLGETEVTAFNVTILDNYDVACSRTDKESCGSTVTVYTDDEANNDCKPCMGEHIKKLMAKPKSITIGGTITGDGKWVLNGREIRCIFSPNHKAKNISRWLKNHSCKNGSQRSSCTQQV